VVLGNDKKRIINYFKTRGEVASVYLFGSAAQGAQNAESDIDIAVLVDDKKLKNIDYEALRQGYYAASPHLSLRIVDIVILNPAPPYLKHRILKTGTLLFDRNRRLRVRFTAGAVLEYFDYKPIEDICLRAVAGRFRRATVGR
jgi:predicted nucleotidyltransferase